MSAGSVQAADTSSIQEQIASLEKLTRDNAVKADQIVAKAQELGLHCAELGAKASKMEADAAQIDL